MARYVEYQKGMAYRIFVTDALYENAEHLMIPSTERWIDIISPEKHEEEERSGDEIAMDVIKNAGLVVR
jgi:hypothetical protein